jgi:hypothetical protein
MDLTPDSTTIRLANSQSPDWEKLIPPKGRVKLAKMKLEKLIGPGVYTITTQRVSKLVFEMEFTYHYMAFNPPHDKIYAAINTFLKWIPTIGLNLVDKKFQVIPQTDKNGSFYVYFDFQQESPVSTSLWELTVTQTNSLKNLELTPEQVTLVRRFVHHLLETNIQNKINQLPPQESPDYRPSETIPEDYYTQ